MKKIVLALLLFGAVAACKPKDDRGYLVEIGQEAPETELCLDDSTRIGLSSLRGKVVMLQFTATWCPVCLKEMPHIEKEIWKPLRGNDDFALYGVMYKEGAGQVGKMRSLTGATYPLVPDSLGTAFHSFAKEGAGVTRNVVIDRDGKIVFLTRLFDEKEFNEMIETIRKELAK